MTRIAMEWTDYEYRIEYNDLFGAGVHRALGPSVYWVRAVQQNNNTYIKTIAWTGIWYIESIILTTGIRILT